MDVRISGGRLRRHPVECLVRSRFFDADGPVAGISVIYKQPRAAVVRRLHQTLAEPPRLAREDGEVSRADEIEVVVKSRVTDRFIKGLGDGYVHEDLVSGTSHAVCHDFECAVA